MKSKFKFISEIQLNYPTYLAMSHSDKIEIWKFIYAYYNNLALNLDLDQREIFEKHLEEAIEQQEYELCQILKDFEHHFGDTF